MTQVKICGISRTEDGLAALEAGADLLGFVFYPPSHRYVNPEQAAELVAAGRADAGRDWKAVGVFVNLPLEEVNAIAERADLDLVQLCGEEDPEYCAGVERPVVKVVRVNVDGSPAASTDPRDWNAERILLDTAQPGMYGGTGRPFDWTSVRPFAGRAILAGGLSPDNVGEALRAAAPWGLDVSSGVERDKHKDPDLIRAFIREARRHAVAT
jgi:phosphoribosylanthranilate isomerase